MQNTTVPASAPPSADPSADPHAQLIGQIISQSNKPPALEAQAPEATISEPSTGQKPRQRKARPTPAPTIVIHGGHNIVAHHGAVVHWHQAATAQP